MHSALNIFFWFLIDAFVKESIFIHKLETLQTTLFLSEFMTDRGELGKTGKSGANRMPPSSLCKRCSRVDNKGASFHLDGEAAAIAPERNRLASFVPVKKILFDWFLLRIFEQN